MLSPSFHDVAFAYLPVNFIMQEPLREHPQWHGKRQESVSINRKGNHCEKVMEEVLSSNSQRVVRTEQTLHYFVPTDGNGSGWDFSNSVPEFLCVEFAPLFWKVCRNVLFFVEWHQFVHCFVLFKLPLEWRLFTRC